MSIKQTGELQIITDQSFTEQMLVINPNDGFDLGLMMTEATVELEYNFNQETTESITAQVIQKNGCRLGTLELGNKSASRLNGNTKVRLTIEEQDGNPKLIIGPV
ncbi:MAG: hypothetical protein KAH95_05855 [Spirochaetales bacterium]|nr:hypothetical protein [Spirochaetales bacterium]